MHLSKTSVVWGESELPCGHHVLEQVLHQVRQLGSAVQPDRCGRAFDLVRSPQQAFQASPLAAASEASSPLVKASNDASASSTNMDK